MPKLHARALRDLLATDAASVSSLKEFIDAQRDAKTVSFVDSENLASLDRLANDLAAATDQPTPAELRRLMAAVTTGPIVAVTSAPLAKALDWLPSHPWLSHVLSAAILESDLAKS